MLSLSCKSLYTINRYTINRYTINRYTINRYYTNSIHKKETFQYISDVHVDINKNVIDIIPIANTLIIAGDIGNPKHKHFEIFINKVSLQFKTVIYVAGNHCYDSGCIYDDTKYKYYKPIIIDILSNYKNVHYLDNNIYVHDDTNIIIAGTTLYTNPINYIPINYIPINPILTKKLKQHTNKHQECIQFINTVCTQYYNKDVIIVSHYVPTYSLIEDKYKKLGPIINSKFTTNLEYLFKKPIKAWICGHSHSIINSTINNVYCGINACSKLQLQSKPQTFTIY